MRALLLGVALLAAMARPAWADYAAGNAAFKSGDYAAAFEAWKPLAAEGDPRAEYGLALLYERGLGVDHPDPTQALHWYREAARQGLPAAQNNLALIYVQGRGVAADLPAAIDLWQSAARAGHGPSQYNLGLAYARGLGVKHDDAEAVRWYAAAASQGVAAAQLSLADAYRKGRGVPRDPVQARHWYEEAARNGSAEAAQWLAAAPSPTAGGNARASAASQPSAPASDAESPPSSPHAAAAENTPAPPAVAGDLSAYRVQLSSNRSEQGAADAVRILDRRYQPALEGIGLQVRRVDLGAERGVWYRVVSHALPDRPAAQAICDRIRALVTHASCLVTHD